MRLAALGFAVIAFTASASLAQGVPALRQAPIGHRQPTTTDLPPDVRREEQPPSVTSQPAGATPRSSSAPLQSQTARTRGGSPPTLQVGPSCEAAGRGAVVLGRNKEACLGDETTAQDTLKQNWSKYPGTDKTTCIGMTSTGGPASYVELLSCLEILREAKSIEATDPLAGEMEAGASHGDATRAPRVRYRHANRRHQRAL
jgi:hypothetical protein